jgi:hypothetical protein
MLNIRRLGAAAAAVLAVLAPTAAAGPQGPARGAGWDLPACSAVTGTAAVTFTRDDGKTLAPTSGELHGVGYTYGLVALDTPGVLLAEHGRTVLRSTDAGCTWAAIGTVDAAPMTLAAAPGARAYGWTPFAVALARIDGEMVTPIRTPPVDQVVGFGTDLGDHDHARLADSSGVVWETLDAGASWERIGISPAGASSVIYYSAVFDPHDMDHVVIGTSVEGAFASRDGGRTWTKARGFSDGGTANVFSFAISPASGLVVWAMGLDLAELDSGAASGGRHIYRSTDGGLTYKPVVKQTPKVTLTNGPLLVAHPSKKNVLYFVFGTYFQNYGTDIFRFDAKTKKLRKTHNDYDDVSAIAFNPADPGVMYLGLTVEEIGKR